MASVRGLQWEWREDGRAYFVCRLSPGHNSRIAYEALDAVAAACCPNDPVDYLPALDRGEWPQMRARLETLRDTLREEAGK